MFRTYTVMLLTLGANVLGYGSRSMPSLCQLLHTSLSYTLKQGSIRLFMAFSRYELHEDALFKRIPH